jgi:hypothetical protein
MDPIRGKLSRDVDAACIIAAAGPVEHDWEFGIGCGVCRRPDRE